MTEKYLSISYESSYYNARVGVNYTDLIFNSSFCYRNWFLVPTYTRHEHILSRTGRAERVNDTLGKAPT